MEEKRVFVRKKRMPFLEVSNTGIITSFHVFASFREYLALLCQDATNQDVLIYIIQVGAYVQVIVLLLTFHD